MMRLDICLYGHSSILLESVICMFIHKFIHSTCFHLDEENRQGESEGAKMLPIYEVKWEG